MIEGIGSGDGVRICTLKYTFQILSNIEKARCVTFHFENIVGLSLKTLMNF